MTDIETTRTAFFNASYGDYYEAAQRPRPTHDENKEKLYNPNSFANVKIVLMCVGELLFAILLPFALVLTVSYFFAITQNLHSVTMTLLALSIYPVLRHFYGVVIKSPLGKWCRPFHSRYAPGVYASPDVATQRLLNLCPSLRHDGVIFGDLFDSRKNTVIRATPWLLSGDFRTLLPFLSVHPPTVQYQRRWIRVPLADHNRVCKEESDDAMEAVALDWMPPLTSPSTEEPLKAVFLLAGLTGGSQEGYVKDFVYRARNEGLHVFVMVGRGLQDCPIASDALFHGARVSDAITCARILRESLGPDATIVAAGISLGGFIVNNALVKATLSQYVDGVVNVAGCFDTQANLYFGHSRRLWQPLLAFGLKENIVASKKGWAVIKRRFASLFQSESSASVEKTEDNDNDNDNTVVTAQCTRIVDSIVDVYDYDSILVTGVNGFASVEDYYREMSAAPAMRQQAAQQSKDAPLRFPVPLLVIHALDDPIIHVNTIPADPHSVSSVFQSPQPWLWENSIVLLTAMGGHMGWPLGWLPWRHGFRFTNTIIVDFLEGIHTCKQSPIDESDQTQLRKGHALLSNNAQPLSTSFRDATIE